jgi:hypothetical protein
MVFLWLFLFIGSNLTAQEYIEDLRFELRLYNLMLGKSYKALVNEYKFDLVREELGERIDVPAIEYKNYDVYKIKQLQGYGLSILFRNNVAVKIIKYRIAKSATQNLLLKALAFFFGFTEVVKTDQHYISVKQPRREQIYTWSEHFENIQSIKVYRYVYDNILNEYFYELECPIVVITTN